MGFKSALSGHVSSCILHDESLFLLLKTNKEPGVKGLRVSVSTHCLLSRLCLFCLSYPLHHTLFYLCSQCRGAFVLADDFIIKNQKQQALFHSHSSSHTQQ